MHQLITTEINLFFEADMMTEFEEAVTAVITGVIWTGFPTTNNGAEDTVIKVSKTLICNIANRGALDDVFNQILGC